MRKWKRALAFMLALVMALSLVALPSFAEGEETGSAVTGGSTHTTGLELSKVYNPETGLLTLEAYATGSTTTTTSTAPVDIVLVLDVSGSMKDPITSYTYTAAYNPSTGWRAPTYYYQDSNGQYQQAHYCEGNYGYTHDAGWYTEEHYSDIWGSSHGGTRLTPKTSASDTDTSHTQFYTRTESGSVTKMEALKTAVKGFVSAVSEKSPESSIAIVKFGGEINNQIGNDRYNYNRESINYTQTVKGLTLASSAAELNAEIDTLRYGGYTPAHLGLQLAKGIIENDPNTDRQKVVVLFTDGEPNGVGNTTSGFQTAAANNAIANSKSIKDAGATVYTIGCFGSLSGNNKTNVDTYMNRVSSNYPDATSMNDGTRGVGDFYKTVSSASELESIFQEISSTAGGATLTLDSQTVLKDVVSDYFDLPANASSQITAQSYSCTGFDASGNPTWSDTPDAASYAVKVDGKNVSVSGFNYSDNWVGKDTTTGAMHNPGKKLVVTIPIEDNGTGMGTVPTNAETSAVYDKDGSLVCAFAVPTAYFPYFTVTHIQSNVDDSGKNYGVNAGSTKHRVPTDGEKFNLTSVVNVNYLYGGSFTGEDCTTVQPYNNGENPTAFTPQDKAEYFIWEVPDYYLRPANYYVWRHLPENNGQKTVVRLYPLTSVDRMLYKEVGFQINGTDYVSGTNNREFDESVGSAGTAQLYQMVKAVQNGQPYMTMYVNKGKINATAVGTDVSADKTVNGTPIDEGFIGGLRLPQTLFDQFAAGTSVTYRPYWITLDGVKVLGVRDRTSIFEAGSTQPKDSSNKYPAEYSYVSAASTQAMSFAEYFTMDDSQPVVDESLTVTVVDGSNTTQVKVAPNGSVRDQVAYQAPAGKVFAGWFADQAYTTPADLDQVTEDTTIYAKYVSDSYLDLAYSRVGLLRLRGVTLISAVDNPANYQASGFIVEGEKVGVSYASRYLIFKTPANLFGAARNAQLMLADQSLSGTGTLEVTPYWVTLDGTEVQGQTHTLHYNTRTIWE